MKFAVQIVHFLLHFLKFYFERYSTINDPTLYIKFILNADGLLVHLFFLCSPQSPASLSLYLLRRSVRARWCTSPGTKQVVL